MWKGKCTILGVLFVFFSLSVMAQNYSGFIDLKRSLEKNERADAVTHYEQVFPYVFTSDFNLADFEQLLDYSHQLSRKGYAETVYTNLEKIARPEKIKTQYNEATLSLFYNELGYAYYYGNKLTKADSAFHLNLALAEKFKTIPQLNFSFSYNFLGLIHRRINNYDQALEYLNKAKEIRIVELGEKSPQVGSIYNNIGLVYKSKGNYIEASTNYRKAIEIKLLADDLSVYRNYINMGELYTILGNYTAALDYFKRADKILSGEKEPAKLADTYFNIGSIFILLKANREAFEYFQKALKIYHSVYGEDHEKVADVYQNMANVYDEMGEREKGREAIEKAITIIIKTYGDQSQQVAPLYNNLGLVYQNLENYRSSLFYLKKAGNIYKTTESKTSEKYLNTLINIAETYAFSANKDSAIYYFHDVAEKLNDLFEGKHPLLAYSYNKLAEIFYRVKDYERAGMFVNEAILANLVQIGFFRSTKRCLDPSYLFESYLLSGQITAAESELYDQTGISGLFYFQQADSILSQQRNFLSDKQDKIALARNSKRLAEAVLESAWLLRNNLNPDDLEIAFRYVEKSKNLVLLQSIAENDGKNYAGIPDSVLYLENDLLSKINHYNHRLEIEKDSLQRIQMEEDLFDWKLQYKMLVEKLEKEYTKYYELKYKEDVPDILDVQKALHQQEVVLNYFVSDKSLFLFTISKQSVELAKLPADNLGDLLVGMRKSIDLQLDEYYYKKAHELHNLIIPQNLVDHYRSILVVPDGGLSVLPFEALLSKPVKGKNEATDWPFLLKNFDISYSPSLALLTNLRNGQAELDMNNSLLGIAPVFEPSAELEEMKGVTLHKFEEDEFNVSLNELGLAPLYASKTELENIQQLFEDKQLSTKIYLHEDAFEGSLMNDDVLDYRFIHIATHGFVDKSNPELSGLYFAPVKNRNYDNIVYTGEIYNLKFNTELLTLSACETALGKVAEGEGMLGFSRAFLYAGAQNLVLSLWKVNDLSTSVLMTSFYNNILHENMELNRALCKAKRSLIKGGEFSHPYYWAAFVFIGN